MGRASPHFLKHIAAYNANPDDIVRSLIICFLFGKVSMEVCFSTELLVDFLVSEKSFVLADYEQKVIEKTVQLVQAELPEGFCPRISSVRRYQTQNRLTYNSPKEKR